jgi:hypothetical protein
MFNVYLLKFKKDILNSIFLQPKKLKNSTSILQWAFLHHEIEKVSNGFSKCNFAGSEMHPNVQKEFQITQNSQFAKK